MSEEAVNPTRQHSMKCPKLHGKECTCDGYHTFDELYDHRVTLFITLCRILATDGAHAFAKNEPRDLYWRNGAVWRSKLHHDGSFFPNWFIMGLRTDPGRQITYHLPMARWEETEFAYTMEKAPFWDGHTSDDVIERLKNI
jgi:hypothetical protein